MTVPQRNTFVGVTILFVALAVGIFVAALLGSKSGEVASALGGVLGGMIGAAGATFSIYYMLFQQRADESEKTSEAVLAEVAVLMKYLIGHLGLCGMIQTGLKFPRASLGDVIVTPIPVIYPAVADRVSRLPRPTQVVNFYTRLGEIDSIVAMVVHAPRDQGDDGNCTPTHIKGLADLLITECQVAQAILSNVQPDAESEAALSLGLRQQVLAVIDQQLQQAKAVFPDAESFSNGPS